MSCYALVAFPVVAVFTLSFTLWWGASVGHTHRLLYVSPCHITECQAATVQNCVHFHLFIDGFARMRVPEKDKTCESFVDWCFLHSQKSLLSVQMWRRNTQGKQMDRDLSNKLMNWSHVVIYVFLDKQTHFSTLKFRGPKTCGNICPEVKMVKMLLPHQLDMARAEKSLSRLSQIWKSLYCNHHHGSFPERQLIKWQSTRPSYTHQVQWQVEALITGYGSDMTCSVQL